jgi:hypothetical protein
MTPEELKRIREQHAECSPTALSRLPQKTCGRVSEGRCHMPGTQCQHIAEYKCLQCGFGYAEERKA